jgi:hypothetical protein
VFLRDKPSRILKILVVIEEYQVVLLFLSRYSLVEAFLNSEGGQFKNNLLKRFKALCKKAEIENEELVHIRGINSYFAVYLFKGKNRYKVIRRIKNIPQKK